ncbi:MAG: hypothetical protein HN416_12980 [Nitrospina sp.]|jgi:hypothetical protein|nr:hypothetical protein [Nitrospina sp.]
MAETARKIEETPTAGDIAERVAGLLKKKADLEPKAAKMSENVFVLEEKRLNGQKVPDATYRKARQEIGDIESQLEAIDHMVASLIEKGQARLSSELNAYRLELDQDRRALLVEQKDAVKDELMPIFETWLITRQRIIGCEQIPADREYLNSLPGISYDLDTRQRMNGHLEKLRKDLPAGTLADRRKAVDDDIKRINSGKMPDFAQLVVEARKEYDNGPIES